MADIFLRKDARKLMKGKKILFLGDSILRNIYQDIVWLLEHGTLTPADLLKNGTHTPADLLKKDIKMDTFCGDKLVPGTGDFNPVAKYWEVRELTGGNKLEGISATFVFLTRCFSKRLEDFIYKNREDPPDIVLVLSAFWDVNRWGPHGIGEYKENCPKLLKLLNAAFPRSTQVIWLTSPPIAEEVWGSTKFDLMEANTMVANNATAFGQDVVDLHYWMTRQINKRLPDGIHWTPDAKRMQVNIILTHLCLSRALPLPSKLKGKTHIEKAIEKANVKDYQMDDTKSPKSQKAEDRIKVNPRGSTEPKVNPRGSTEPKVNPRGSTEPKVNPRGSTEPKVNPRGSTEPKVNPRGSTEPKVNPRGSTEPKGNPRGLTEPNEDYNGICWSCSKTKMEVKLNKCAGCKKARYCSRECIEHDWSVHKNWCLKRQKKREVKI